MCTVPLASARAQTAPGADLTGLATPRIPGPRPMPSALQPGATRAAALPSANPDTLPCPDCDPPKRFWMSVGDVLIMQLVPFGVSNLITDEVWANVSPQTWANNFNYPWLWDDNDFQNNQFAHSYQGAGYYNAARTNGYNFWASSLWPIGGSLMWEYFFEAWAPAPNDFVNTAVGGVAMGETLYRLSVLTLDNTATGGERVWREIGGAILNPIGGLNRLLRGDTHRVSANPPEWRPVAILGVLDAGYRRTSESFTGTDATKGSNQLNVSLLLSYGDPAKDLGGAPFSYFAVRADLAGPSSGTVVNQFSARGSLAAWPLDGARRHQIALSLEYDYFSNPAFTYGGQSIQLGLVSVIGAPGKTWWGQTNLLFNGVILGAAQSDYYETLEGRNYDYGPGIGGIASGRILYKNRVQGTAAYTGLWIHTIDGTDSEHYQDALLLEGRFWLARGIGVGASYTVYNRRSDYSDLPEVTEAASFLRLFLSTAIPGLPTP
jgi:hypothetical protein